MRKYLLLILFFIMFIPVVVDAEECDTSKVNISSITLDQKDNVEEKVEATASGKNINLNLGMSDVGDNIRYRIVIKNDSNDDYLLDKNSVKVSSNYIDYTIESSDNSNIIKARTAKAVYLNVQYSSPVPADAYQNGVFNDKVDMKLNLSSNGIENPNTGIEYYIFFALVILINIIMFIIFKRKRKVQSAFFIVEITLLIPMGVYALCKCDITINSNIEITAGTKFTGVLYRNNFLSVKNGTDLSKGFVLRNGYDYYYETLNECNAAIGYSNGVCETIEEYFNNDSGFTENASTIHKDWYLKHDIERDVIKNTYFCFIDDDVEYCMKGGDNGENYLTNAQIIRDFNSRHSYCTLDNSIDGRTSCSGAYSMYLSASSTGEVSGNLVGGLDCHIDANGVSACT